MDDKHFIDLKRTFYSISTEVDNLEVGVEYENLSNSLYEEGLGWDELLNERRVIILSGITNLI